ncbi:hypothetical protein [Singulisphaera acidiphila]|uniref:Uncharacterized protein n=1 Tax=Singulisphaera acidiphila (strain ATCC BAA-1392 / DSM 18658 / VKM B-2454 / MOB10) TaxID=886293 RepID=L0DRJ2_SINAD|nr:hypothetical protein [Singulisphaera acidiphila]AGA31638.1 hypothetical protein Sinac_7607 [Singulisphaera acidiphila DSM 18658]
MGAVLEMAEPKKRGGPRSGSGRPKGSGPGRINTTFAVKVTPEYKTWMGSFAEQLGGTEADLFREAMKLLATDRGFRLPPLR